MDIRDWLEQNGLSKYTSVFAENEIDLISLPELTEADLREMGLPIGPRRRLLKAVRDPAGASAAADAVEPGPVPATDAEHRQITVLFCDLVGSTALSEELDPEDLRDLMAAYQKAAGAVVERNDGHVAQYLGDGLMVYFGWPVAHEEDAGRAVRAGLELVEAVKQVNAAKPLRVRIGIATGTVVVGETGAGDASVPKAAVGETPNLAARMQGLAGSDEIVITPTTRRLVGGAFDCEDLGEQDVRGIAEPIRAWRVIRESAIHDRFEARVMDGLTPFVGRDSEIALLLERWNEAKEGEGQVVLLSGEPGIGKSRITRVLREALVHEPHTRLRYQCSPYYRNTAFYPIIDQLEHAAGYAHDAPANARLDKLEMLLNRGTEETSSTASLVAALLSLPVDRYPPLNLSAQRQKEKTIEVLAGQVARLARQKPVLMIFEDAHWADPSTLDLLGAVIERIQDAAVLLVVTCRPEFEPSWRGYSHVTLHSLNRLSRRQGALLVAKVAGDESLPEDVLDQIITKTDGVPLFAEELTKTVLETGLGAGRERGTAAAAVIPATLQDSLMARLDRLGSGKELAQICACIGRDFDYRLLVNVAAEAHAEIDAALSQLMDAELLYRRGRPPDATYSFKHALVQETAYRSLLKSRRQPIHARIADTLREGLAGIAEGGPELLAHHYTEAGLVEQAIPFWREAGRQAVQRSASIEAVGHFAKALDVLRTLPESPERNEEELRLQVALAVPLAATTGFASAEMEQVYARARELCGQVGDTSRLFPVLYGLWDFYLVRADYKAAHGEALQLLALVEGTEDTGLLLEAHRAMGATSYYLGEFVAARDHLDVATAVYEPRQHRDHVTLYRQEPGVACLSYGAWALWCLGYPEQAMEKMHEAVDLAQESLHPFSLAWALNFAGRMHEFRREGQAARERAEAAIALATEQGFAYWLAWGTVMRGWALSAQGHGREGIAEMRRGVNAIRATGTEIARSQDLGLIAGAQCALGQTREGLATLEDALAVVEQSDEHYYEAELHRLKGELSLQAQIGGQLSGNDAEACFRKAIEVARLQQAKSFELRAATSLARLWEGRDRRSEAREMLLDVYDWFTEGFDTKDIREAKALLDALE